jgi:hypothetical protein
LAASGARHASSDRSPSVTRDTARDMERPYSSPCEPAPDRRDGPLRRGA